MAKKIDIPIDELRDYAKTMVDKDIARIYGCNVNTIASYREANNILHVYKYRQARDGIKICSYCKERKPVKDFSKHKVGSDGYRSRCKPCRSSLSRKYQLKNWRRKWASGSLYNHRKRGYDISLVSTEELYELSLKNEKCQICERALSWEGGRGHTLNDPTLDRTDNEKVLSMSNIQIVCHRCNVTKSDRTMDEFIEYCKFVSERFE